MNWRNTKLIFRRELADQWRDRRTIFTIVVMPLVLYPLMGMALLQTAQLMRHEPARVLFLDTQHLEANPPLLEKGQIVPRYLAGLEDKLVTLGEDDVPPDALDRIQQNLNRDHHLRETAALLPLQSGLRRAKIDLLLVCAPEASDTRTSPVRMFVNSSSDRSALAAGHIGQIVDRWRRDVIAYRLQELDIDANALDQVRLETVEIASPSRRKAAMWAKLLPFVVLVWALTGAFYPAIDVCAGEKERGTLETLLSSPARRSEIVAGKWLTVATFSIATALLNLVSMTFTGLLVMGQLAQMPGSSMGLDIGFPPLTSIPWLMLGLIPISALFSALALALAAFARSSKEGQYYLVPMLMSLLPLMMLSMLPSAKLELGTSLIPLTGMLLLLKNLMLEEYATALQYAGPVLAITLICCWLAARWAVLQFNNESVLFRSGEQFHVTMWIRHLVRDRGLTPTIGEALLCGVIILVVKFFVGLSGQMSLTFGGFSKQVIVTQVATIALPAVLMALFLTRSPRRSLKLNVPRFPLLPACMLLAILLHPAIMLLSQWVMQMYPPSVGLEQIESAISAILSSAPNPWFIVLVIAVVPAICEELAFRGFILSGLESIRGKWTAILLSALFFGAAHGILQQSILASVTGVILGIIAVQTHSLLPCIVYHATHNSLPVLMSYLPVHAVQGSYLGYVFKVSQSGALEYSWLATIVMPMIGLAVLIWLWKHGGDRPRKMTYLSWGIKTPAGA